MRRSVIFGAALGLLAGFQAAAQTGTFHPRPGTVATAPAALPKQPVVPVAPLRVLEPTRTSEWRIGSAGWVKWDAKPDVKYPLWLFLVSADHRVPIMDMGKIGSESSRLTQTYWTVTNNIYEGQYCVRITSADNKAQVHSPPFSIVYQTEEIVLPAFDYKNWSRLLPRPPDYAQPPAAAVAAHPVAPQVTGAWRHAIVGYNYFSFVWPQTGNPGWTTNCYRCRVFFFIEKLQPKASRFVSAKLHMKQVAVDKENDTSASCATGYFILTALWNDWYNPSITTPTPTAGLNPGSADYTIDVTPTVRDWLTKARVNYGFFLNSREVTWGQQAKKCGSLFDAELILKFRKN